MPLGMTKATHISEHKGHKELTKHQKILEYLDPKYVYFPAQRPDLEYEVLVKVGDEVKIGDVLTISKAYFPVITHSSVSGKVTAVDKKVWHPSGRKISAIEIENNFKEEVTYLKEQPLTKEGIIEAIKQAGIVGMGGAGFPTHVKYHHPKFQTDTLIVNAVECEPYLTCDCVSIKYRAKELIQGIKYAMIANDAKRAVIAVKVCHKDVIAILEEELAKEENISLHILKDVYPAGWEKYIVEKVQKKTYKGLPCETGAVVSNVSTLIAINDAVSKKMPSVERVITVSGEGIKNPQNVLVKIGTLASEIIDKTGGYADDLEGGYLVAGGPMTGTSQFFDSFMVEKTTTGILVFKEQKGKEDACLGCGKCIDTCPVKLSPILIKLAHDDKDKEKMTQLHADLCMECGLCSYVCPSRIELTEAVGKAKKVVRGK